MGKGCSLRQSVVTKRFLLLICLISALCIATPCLAANDASDVETLIKEGIKLYDQGNYQMALEKYQAALAIDPTNIVTLYELALTYNAVGQYAQCADSAWTGLTSGAVPEVLQGQLYNLQGSCLSAQGLAAAALQAFRLGLAMFPDDPMLNLNIAVTLANTGQVAEAIAHLKKAIVVRPTYATPYMYLAQIYQRSGDRISSLFYYLRLTMIEKNTTRTVQAAKQINSLINAGISRDESGKVNVKITPAAEGSAGNSAALELALSMVAAKAYAEDAPGRMPAEQFAGVLVAFLQICNELGERAFTEADTWKLVVQPVLQVSAKGGAEAFAYLLASRAELKGGTEWIKAHASEVTHLNEIMAQIAASAQGR